MDDMDDKPKTKFETKLVHPGYVIEECPACGFPEADGGYCPDCGWMKVQSDCPHCRKAESV